MNQVRFKVGVPGAGSAARHAENSAGSPLGSIRPHAGSAARAAEEQKRAEPVITQCGATVGMRAQGGRVVTAEEMRAASARLSTSPQTFHEDKKAVIERLAVPAASAVAGPVNQTILASSTDIAEPIFEESASGPLQTVAVRIKSLVQSLFHPRASTSKS